MRSSSLLTDSCVLAVSQLTSCVSSLTSHSSLLTPHSSQTKVAPRPRASPLARPDRPLLLLLSRGTHMQ
eukprot:1092981-Rhodomonas_salina.1